MGRRVGVVGWVGGEVVVVGSVVMGSGECVIRVFCLVGCRAGYRVGCRNR